MDTFWNNPQLSNQLAENGFNKVQKKYSSLAYYKKLENTYLQLVKK